MVAEEKNVDAIKGKVFEAKTMKSYDSYQILGKFIGMSSLTGLLQPLKQVRTLYMHLPLYILNRLKFMKSWKDCIIKIIWNYCNFQIFVYNSTWQPKLSVPFIVNSEFVRDFFIMPPQQGKHKVLLLSVFGYVPPWISLPQPNVI